MLFAESFPKEEKTKLRRDALSMGNTKELDLPFKRSEHTTNRNLWLFSFVTQCHIFKCGGLAIENRKHAFITKEVQAGESQRINIGRFE